MKNSLIKIIDKCQNRRMFCTELIEEFNLKKIAELGVFRGKLAVHLLQNNQSIESYTMIDPWRNLPNWNKPSNKDNKTFEEFYQETISKTDFAKEKRKILRGKTTEVINQIENEAFDFVYIDGDHTLKGITIDLINMWPKIKEHGFIVGDDFSSSIWQHNQVYEPTMVFPFAVYFAEAVNVKIYALPFDQFLINKGQTGFEFINLTNSNYYNLELKSQFIKKSIPSLKEIIKKNIQLLKKIYSIFKK